MNSPACTDVSNKRFIITDLSALRGDVFRPFFLDLDAKASQFNYSVLGICASGFRLPSVKASALPHIPSGGQI